MKRPTMLLKELLINYQQILAVPVERDFQEIESRFENEGLSFLTITLPSLCDTLDQGLAKGRVTRSMYHGFKSCSRRGSLPALLSGFFTRVFDSDGHLLSSPCIDSIEAIRMVCRLFKKVVLPCSSARVKRAFERYEEVDVELSEPQYEQHARSDLYRYVAGCLWSPLEEKAASLFCAPSIFGKGASAERRSRNDRQSVVTWPIRCEASFPVSHFGPSRVDNYEFYTNLEFHSESDELPVRVVQVPKTLKTPRTISVEPSYMMLMQQSIAGLTMDLLENGHLGFKSIRFSDQTVNRDMARLGSVDGRYATIDLKDASDRVSNELVKITFQSCPTYLGFLQDSRSTRAKLPSGRIIKLNKFASMGSAMCFPIEAMVFLTIATTAICRSLGRRPSPRQIRSIANGFAIYGDDIITSDETSTIVMKELEAFGLKVNHDKSFTTGLFRESCGGDYYRGHEVTPVYLRRLTIERTDAHSIAAWVSLSNQFYLKGLWHVAQRCREYISSVTRFKFARTTTPVGVLTFASVSFDTGLRWDDSYNGYRVRGFKLVPSRLSDPVRDLDGFLRLCHGQIDYRESRNQFRQFGKFDFDHGDIVSRRISPCSETLPDDVHSWTSSFSRTTIKSIVSGMSGSFERDPLTSDKPYALSAKRTWASVQTNIKFL